MHSDILVAIALHKSGGGPKNATGKPSYPERRSRPHQIRSERACTSCACVARCRPRCRPHADQRHQLALFVDLGAPVVPGAAIDQPRVARSRGADCSDLHSFDGTVARGDWKGPGGRRLGWPDRGGPPDGNETAIDPYTFTNCCGISLDPHARQPLCHRRFCTRTQSNWH